MSKTSIIQSLSILNLNAAHINSHIIKDDLSSRGVEMDFKVFEASKQKLKISSGVFLPISNILTNSIKNWHFGSNSMCLRCEMGGYQGWNNENLFWFCFFVFKQEWWDGLNDVRSWGEWYDAFPAINQIYRQGDIKAKLGGKV
jgi:hypothetical protein